MAKTSGLMVMDEQKILKSRIMQEQIYIKKGTNTTNLASNNSYTPIKGKKKESEIYTSIECNTY